MKISIQDNVVTIGVTENGSIDLGAIPSEIKRVGYAPSGMTVRAIGAFEGGSAFRPRGAAGAFQLSKPIQPAPDTMVEVTASVDFGGEGLLWTIQKVGS